MSTLYGREGGGGGGRVSRSELTAGFPLPRGALPHRAEHLALPVASKQPRTPEASAISQGTPVRVKLILCSKNARVTRQVKV